MIKKILFFIAENGFRDEEYFDTKQVLEDAGFVCESVSTSDVQATGSMGAIVMPTMSLDLVDLNDFSAIVIVGGPGAKEMFRDIRIEVAVKEAFKNNLLICAICIAPAILASLNLIEGRSATVWSGAIDELKEHKTIYSDKPVVVDSSKNPVLITANGPDSAESFGREISDFLRIP